MRFSDPIMKNGNNLKYCFGILLRSISRHVINSLYVWVLPMDAAKTEELETKRSDDWLVLFLVSANHGIGHLANFVYPFLLPAIMNEFSLNYALAGLLMTSSQVTAGLPQVVVGVLQQRVKRKIMMAVGTVWNSLLTMCGYFATSFGHLLSTRVLAGPGASVQHPLGSSMLAERFAGKRMGMAMGFNIAGATVGSIVATMISPFLFQSFGWRTTLMIIGIPGIVTGLMFLICQRNEKETFVKRIDFSF